MILITEQQSWQQGLFTRQLNRMTYRKKND
jgi:hypothetical protein